MSTTIRLLLVEDDPLLQHMLEEGLGDAGFELVVTSHGSAAMAHLDANFGSFDAVITDIRLGDGPSGWDVGCHIRALDPDMPVVYMSGDSASEWASKGVSSSIMIEKPFVIAQIVSAVATVLNNDGMKAMPRLQAV